MAIINYTDQLKYTGKGYLDSKMMPVNTYSDLQNIPRPQRFEGLTITVLNNGNPQDYWLIGGTSNSCWVPKTATNQIEINKENINKNKVDIKALTDRVNALSASAEGSTPDGKTIGITDDEQKALYVKVLNKEGNMLSVENENGESGLCAFIPFYCEDDEINE